MLGVRDAEELDSPGHVVSVTGPARDIEASPKKLDRVLGAILVKGD